MMNASSVENLVIGLKIVTKEVGTITMTGETEEDDMMTMTVEIAIEDATDLILEIDIDHQEDQEEIDPILEVDTMKADTAMIGAEVELLQVEEEDHLLTEEADLPYKINPQDVAACHQTQETDLNYRHNTQNPQLKIKATQIRRKSLKRFQ